MTNAYVNETLVAVLLTLGVGVSGAAQAALIDRGGGLIYDDVLDVTWLQDVGYARTSGYDADGKMNWTAAVDWVEKLSYFDSVRNATWSDWRLPTVAPINGVAFNYALLYNGSSDIGHNLSYSGWAGDASSAYPNSTASEMAYMYSVNLHNLSYYTTQPNYRPASAWYPKNWGPFTHAPGADDTTWFFTGTETLGNDPINRAFAFSTFYGGQTMAPKGWELYAWAVREGDVLVTAGTVPVPATAWLFGSGLLGMIGAVRRRCMPEFRRTT